VKKHEPYDPILRVRVYLEGKGLINEETENQRVSHYEQMVKDEARAAEAAISHDTDDMFDYHYAEIPPYLAFQKEYYHRILAARGESASG
jgi:pyruvate dehydrogenase E1 component alpha subunit